MTEQDDDFELVRGSGNLFADFGVPDASLRQLRAILAAEIVKTLDAERLAVRDAEARTGIARRTFPASARSRSIGSRSTGCRASSTGSIRTCG